MKTLLPTERQEDASEAQNGKVCKTQIRSTILHVGDISTWATGSHRLHIIIYMACQLEP